MHQALTYGRRKQMIAEMANSFRKWATFAYSASWKFRLAYAVLVGAYGGAVGYFANHWFTALGLMGVCVVVVMWALSHPDKWRID